MLSAIYDYLSDMGSLLWGDSSKDSGKRTVSGNPSALQSAPSCPGKPSGKSSLGRVVSSSGLNPSYGIQASPSPFTAAKPAMAGGNWFNGMGRKQAADTTSVTVYSPSRKPMVLDSSLLKASGGEGSVYALPRNKKPDSLVKVYKESMLSRPDKMRQIRERLADMLRLQELTKERWLAWPRMACFNASQELVGFAMNRCEGHSLLSLCGGPVAVRRLFPHWDRQNLILTAIDFVEKVKKLAVMHVYVNDFNPTNFLVNAQCKVSFIDCDSYQISRQGGGVHVTTTYYPSHVAPELLRDKSLLTRPRNLHQVEFGVAIVVFNLLMCGLHPYSYYDFKHQDACGTPDENLLRGRCPLGDESHCMLPRGNWYNLWSWMPYRLKSALIGTFRQGHGHPEQRTSLDDLLLELRNFHALARKDVERRSLEPAVPKAKPASSGLGTPAAWKAF